MAETLVGRPGKDFNIKAKRVATGNIAGSSGGDVGVVWDEPFESLDYTLSASLFVNESGDGLEIWRIKSRSTTGCVVYIRNRALTAKTGELHIIAIAD